jgi:transcriptional regulator
MLTVDAYEVTDPAWVRDLVRRVGWGTLVTHGPSGIEASHYPFLLEEAGEDIVLLTHLGKPDDELLDLTGEAMVLIDGPHGYISPSWYPPEQIIPTWNFMSAHLWGVPELLEPEENYRVLTRLVDEFEAPVEAPSSLRLNEAMTRRVAAATTGLRIRVTRFRGKNKLSQDKDPATVRSIVQHLAGTGHYANAPLARAMSNEFGL